MILFQINYLIKKTSCFSTKLHSFGYELGFFYPRRCQFMRDKPKQASKIPVSCKSKYLPTTFDRSIDGKTRSFRVIPAALDVEASNFESFPTTASIFCPNSRALLMRLGSIRSMQQITARGHDVRCSQSQSQKWFPLR